MTSASHLNGDGSPPTRTEGRCCSRQGADPHVDGEDVGEIAARARPARGASPASRSSCAEADGAECSPGLRTRPTASTTAGGRPFVNFFMVETDGYEFSGLLE